MKKIALSGTGALLVGAVFGFGMAPAKATTATFTETTAGIVQAVNCGQVASDGEAAFMPFGVTFDVSDGIVVPTLVTTAPSLWSLSASSTNWTLVTGTTNTWVASAAGENEPSSEPAGIFTNTLPLPAADLGVVTILDSDGVTVSDVITFANVPGAGAQITFQSDPSIVPLPAALPLFATGIGGLGLLGWRRKRKARAVG